MGDIIYVLHPGEISSKTDGDIHHITAPELARLYGIDYKKCRVIYDSDPEKNRGYTNNPEHVHLWPTYSGDYTLE